MFDLTKQAARRPGDSSRFPFSRGAPEWGGALVITGQVVSRYSMGDRWAQHGGVLRRSDFDLRSSDVGRPVARTFSNHSESARIDSL